MNSFNVSYLFNLISCINYTFEDCFNNFGVMIFLRNCNLRCKYCYNIEIAKGKRIMDFNQILDYLSKDYSYVDCIIISGGEPLIYPVEILLQFINYFKELNKNLRFKIDTNGLFPQKLKKIIPYVNYISIDIKRFPFENYGLLFDNEFIENNENLIKNIPLKLKETLEIIKSNINFLDNVEFRTTILKDMEKDEIKNIENFLKKYYDKLFGEKIIYNVKEEIELKTF